MPRPVEGDKLADLNSVSIGALAFSPDGRTLAAGTELAIGLWDVASGKNTAMFESSRSHHLLGFTDRRILDPEEGREPEIADAAFRRNGDLMVLGTLRETVVLWRQTSVPVRK
jgi:hypothetical protein